MGLRFDLSLVSTGFGAFAVAAGVAHICVFLGSGLRKLLPPDRLTRIIPAVTLPSGAWHILSIAGWCAVAALCVAAMAFWARHWFGRVDARVWSRNLALRDRPEPSLR